MYRRTATVTVSALDAAAEETYTITDAKVRIAASPKGVSDVIAISPPSTAEDTWIITKAWVSAVGVIKFSASNVHASAALTGGDIVVTYCVIR
jgi:hypothetical protein